MSGLPPGEQVIKDTGMFPVTWQKGTFGNVNGKLILTNRRLVFNTGRFQDVISSLRQAHKDKAEISLSSITSVDKGFMATINIMAGGQKYVFKGMRDAGGWVQAINSAKMMSGAVSTAAPQGYAPPAPPQAAPAAGNKFCSNCGAPVAAGNAFCGKCGTRVQ
jgi:hypothetical protein